MEPRVIIAYGLLLAMAVLAAVLIGYRVYHQRDRSYRRRLRRELLRQRGESDLQGSRPILLDEK